MILTASFPIKTVSEANQREHWAISAKRHKSHKEESYLYAYKNFGVLPYGTINTRCKVILELTRVASRKLDKDNLYGSMKYVVDGICQWLGIDDGDKRFTLIVGQRIESKANSIDVRISIT